MKKNIYLLGLLLLAACANDDEPTGQQVPNAYPLTIEVTENPLIPDGEEGSSTRAAITTTSSLTTFCMDYVYDTSTHGNEEATINPAGTWDAGTWPYDAASNGFNVDWYAHTSYTKAGSTITSDFNLDGTNRPYISFSVVEDVSKQKDLLVATASGTYTGTNKGKLSFTFDHACSALRFWVKKSTNLNDYTLNISSIVLKNVIKVGKYFFKTGSWELGATSTDYTLYLGSATSLGSDDYVSLQGDGDYLFFIPQALTAWNHTGELSDTYLEITCTIKNGENTVYSGKAYIPFGTANEKPFLKGKKHDVKINIGKNSLYSAPNTKIIN